MSMRTTSGTSRAAISRASRPDAAAADHVDVAFEAQELRQVVAGLGDVIDDEDADLVGHFGLRGSFCSQAWDVGSAIERLRVPDPRGPGTSGG